MLIFKLAADIHHFMISQKLKQITVGFVPTMGALHAGHMALIKAARSDNDLVICSIFVNPTQFNDTKDFEKYPITLEDDIYLLEKSGCNVLFLPSLIEIYPEKTTRQADYQLGYLETILEGKFRPGHFQGVCQVVHRLLSITIPHKLYLGQKDLQQCLVIKKMVDIEKLDVEIIICPIERESDGLAMSSRNRRLNKAERANAPNIYKTLQLVKAGLRPGIVDDIKKEAIDNLTARGFKTDYIEIADAGTLEAIESFSSNISLVVLAAAFVNDVRLIDNIIFMPGITSRI